MSDARYRLGSAVYTVQGVAGAIPSRYGSHARSQGEQRRTTVAHGYPRSALTCGGLRPNAPTISEAVGRSFESCLGRPLEAQLRVKVAGLSLSAVSRLGVGQRGAVAGVSVQRPQ